MSSRLKTTLSSSKLEKEIEKLRNENKWLRLREYVNSISAKDQKTGKIFSKKNLTQTA